VHEAQRHKIAHRLGQLDALGEVRFESAGDPGCGASHASEIHARRLEGPDGPVIVSVIRDISDRLRAEQIVRHLAYHDSLTGLANRALLGQELIHAIAAADRHDDHVGLVFIDLDDFKPVNDTHGHAYGDHALREISRRISSCVRLTDTVARVGGDEFIVLLPRLRSTGDLQRVAHKIANKVERPLRLGDSSVTITASMGLALYHAGESPEEFVTRADRAMYECKGAGMPGWSLAAT
jgi:diguanylate cyclase (GGDEF)-like protein